VNPLQNYSVISTHGNLIAGLAGAVNISGALVALSFPASHATSMVVASVGVTNNLNVGMAVNGSVTQTLTVQHGNAFFAGTAPGVTVSPPGTKTTGDPTVPNLLLTMLEPDLVTLADQLAKLPSVPVNTFTGSQIIFNGAAYTNTAVFVTDLQFLSTDGIGRSCVITAPTGSPKAVIINVLVSSGASTVQCTMSNGALIQAITIWNFISDGDIGLTVTIGATHLFEGSALWMNAPSGSAFTAGDVSGSIASDAPMSLQDSIAGNSNVNFPVSTVCSP
jgi:hypothetical protein